MKNIIEYLFYGSMKEQFRDALENCMIIFDKPITWVFIFKATIIELILYIKEKL